MFRLSGNRMGWIELCLRDTRIQLDSVSNKIQFKEMGTLPHEQVIVHKTPCSHRMK